MERQETDGGKRKDINRGGEEFSFSPVPFSHTSPRLCGKQEK
jgi:hypothetical protein